MKLHNAWLLKTSSKKKTTNKQTNKQKQKTNTKKMVAMGLDNTAKAVDHVKIESI